MGLLSPYNWQIPQLQTSPLQALSTPNLQPQQQLRAPNLGERLQTAFGNGDDNLMNSSLFQMGLSLLGNARNPQGWAQTAQDLQGINQAQMQRRQLARQNQRQDAADQREATQFGWQQTAQQQSEAQRQRWQDAVNGEQDPQKKAQLLAIGPAGYGDFLLAQQRLQADQGQQNIQNDFERQRIGIAQGQLALDRSRTDRSAFLRGSDMQSMQNVRDAADRAQALALLGGRFMEQNALTGTGPETQYNPFRGWDSGVQNMNSVVSQMTPFMRPTGSGATSDYEQRLYQRGVQSPTNSPQANQEIYRNQQTLAQLAQARRYFYEDWASQRGTLNGAEQAFRQSPQFQQIMQTNPTQERSTARQGGSSQGASPSSETSFNSLPPARGMREGQTITDTQTGRRFVIRNGQWVPVTTSPTASVYGNGPMRSH